MTKPAIQQRGKMAVTLGSFVVFAYALVLGIERAPIHTGPKVMAIYTSLMLLFLVYLAVVDY